MTITVNIAEARAKLSALIEAAERGEEVILARAGKPVAKLTGLTEKPRRRFGILREMGWTGPPTPYEVFAPEPQDIEWIDQPLFPPPLEEKD